MSGVAPLRSKVKRDIDFPSPSKRAKREKRRERERGEQDDGGSEEKGTAVEVQRTEARVLRIGNRFYSNTELRILRMHASSHHGRKLHLIGG